MEARVPSEVGMPVNRARWRARASASVYLLSSYTKKGSFIFIYAVQQCCTLVAIYVVLSWCRKCRDLRVLGAKKTMNIRLRAIKKNLQLWMSVCPMYRQKLWRNTVRLKVTWIFVTVGRGQIRNCVLYWLDLVNRHQGECIFTSFYGRFLRQRSTDRGLRVESGGVLTSRLYLLRSPG